MHIRYLGGLGRMMVIPLKKWNTVRPSALKYRESGKLGARKFRLQWRVSQFTPYTLDQVCKIVSPPHHLTNQ